VSSWPPTRAGVYPKAAAPKPPFHPHCYCLTAPHIDIFDAKPRFNPKAERAFLAKLPPKEARDIAGSWEKRRRVLEDGETLEAIYNQGKDPLYRWQRLGEVVDNPAMPAFIRSSTVHQAEQEALKLGVKSADYQQSLDIANDINDIFDQWSKKGGVLPSHAKIDPAIFVSWGQKYQFNPDRMPAAFFVDFNMQGSNPCLSGGPISSAALWLVGLRTEVDPIVQTIFSRI